MSKTHLSDVLKDKEAYILLYARDDGGYGVAINGSPNGRPATPQSALSNGVSKINGTSTPKRQAPDSNSLSSPKRQKTSESQDSDDDSSLPSIKSLDDLRNWLIITS